MGTKEGFFDKFRPLAHIPMILGGIALAVGLAFLFGFIVMWLWNWLMPEIFGLPIITYWQAWGLVILAHILVKGGSGMFSGKHEGPKKKIKKEIKREFKKEFRKEMRKEFEKSINKNDPDEKAFMNWVMRDDDSEDSEIMKSDEASTDEKKDKECE